MRRLLYILDNAISKGPLSLITSLIYLSLLTIFLFAVFMWITNIMPEKNIIDIFWFNLMRVLDPGNMCNDNGSWFFMISSLIVTLMGVFLISTVIGLITAAIEEKLKLLRKGKSIVLEKGHIVILGWSNKIFDLINELNRTTIFDKKSFVIMCEKDKAEMIDMLYLNIDANNKIKLICRTGNTYNFRDLEMVNAAAAKTIIILSDGTDQGDYNSVKSIMAIANLPRKPESHTIEIVCELNSSYLCDAANLALTSGLGRKDKLEIVVSDINLSRLIVQCSRSPGLSEIYLELFTYDGCEVYVKDIDNNLIGKSFAYAALCIKNAVLIGIVKEDVVLFNPDKNYKLSGSDSLIVISEDESGLCLHPDMVITEMEINIKEVSLSRNKEKILLVGWNKMTSYIIKEIDKYVLSGSELLLITDKEVDSEVINTIECGLLNLILTYRCNCKSSTNVFEKIGNYFNHILILPESHLVTHNPDDYVIVALLYLRSKIINKELNHDVSIVAELVNALDLEIADLTGPDDFIISERIIAQMISKVIYNRHINDVFNELLSEHGSKIYIKPVNLYADIDKPISFRDLLLRTMEQNEIAIGYRICEYYDDDIHYITCLNPDKTKLISFKEGDLLVVIGKSV